jgi:hypothetical protein
MRLDLPEPDAAPSRRLWRLLVWGGVTVLAAIALALAMVLANLALTPHSDPAPPPTAPIQIPSGGPRPE